MKNTHKFQFLCHEVEKCSENQIAFSITKENEFFKLRVALERDCYMESWSISVEYQSMHIYDSQERRLSYYPVSWKGEQSAIWGSYHSTFQSLHSQDFTDGSCKYSLDTPKTLFIKKRYWSLSYFRLVESMCSSGVYEY